jgi:hypothetical protein
VTIANRATRVPQLGAAAGFIQRDKAATAGGRNV